MIRIGWKAGDALFSFVIVPAVQTLVLAFVSVGPFDGHASEPSTHERKVSREPTLEHGERSLCVEELLRSESARFLDLASVMYGLTGMTGFHVAGNEWHLLLMLHGSSKHRNLWSAMSRKVFLTTSAIAKEVERPTCEDICQEEDVSTS
jgi:hypothetical protein